MEQNKLLIIGLQEYTWIKFCEELIYEPYNTNFKKNKNDNQIITMDSKDTEKLQIYNFINVTHIFHKLFVALTALRLTLTLPIYTIGSY